MGGSRPGGGGDYNDNDDFTDQAVLADSRSRSKTFEWESGGPTGHRSSCGLRPVLQ